jgi:3-oxoacyl-[acyl-carrier-protein] synthase-3
LIRAKISALGCYTPPRALTNQDLAGMLETSDEWITTRTGIKTRYIADKDVATSDLAAEAAQAALAQRGIEASELDAILVCTVTPDMFFPATACLVQRKLGAKKCWGFDILAACSGFLYGLTTAAHLIGGGTHRKVLVIGADTMSRIIDYKDRATCVLFGDGAGAFLLEPAAEGEDAGYIDFNHVIDGAGAPYLYMPAGGSRRPADHETVDQGMHYVHQDGQQVFKFAVRTMFELCAALLKRNNLTAKDIRLMIPHQANKRIITACTDRLGLTEDQVMVNIERYGNTTAGTIPLATRDAIEEGRLKKGDLVLFAAVGAGYTAATLLWRWGF